MDGWGRAQNLQYPPILVACPNLKSDVVFQISEIERYVLVISKILDHPKAGICLTWSRPYEIIRSFWRPQDIGYPDFTRSCWYLPHKIFTRDQNRWYFL